MTYIILLLRGGHRAAHRGVGTGRPEEPSPAAAFGLAACKDPAVPYYQSPSITPRSAAGHPTAVHGESPGHPGIDRAR